MPFRVVVDACVVYPSTTRDVLLSAAGVGLYGLFWSEQILDEAFRNLIKDGRVTPENATRTANTMRKAFPESMVVDYEHLVQAMRNDPKDRHVVAAAVKCGAQVIVTENLKDFYDLPEGVEVQTPQTFLCNLFELDPAKIMLALTHMAARHKKPPTTVERIASVIGQEFLQLVREFQAGT